MKVRHLLFGLLIAANFTAVAQNAPKEVLFTIDNKPFYSDEFSRVYKKNLDLVKDESQKDLNNYLDSLKNSSKPLFKQALKPATFHDTIFILFSLPYNLCLYYL